jgi:Fur family transcriptional regulator, ferric uptake regulator
MTPAKPRKPAARKRSAAETLQFIRDALTRAGLRRTGPRVAVLSRLLDAQTPVSHSEMVRVLQPAGFDPTTIYRNLKDLADAGLVSRRDLGDHTWRYELARDRDAHGQKHPHFLCEDCGRVACLETTRVDIVAGPGAPRSLGRGKVEVQVKGRCDRCR